MKRGMKKNTHPGELIYEDIIKANRLTVLEASRLLHVTRPALSNVLNQKAAISPNMALRLEKVFGGSALFWVRMQAAYDLRKAEESFVESAANFDRFKFLEL